MSSPVNRGHSTHEDKCGNFNLDATELFNDLDAYDGNDAGDDGHVNVHAVEGNEEDQTDMISSVSETKEDDDDGQLIEMYEEPLNDAATHRRSAKRSEAVDTAQLPQRLSQLSTTATNTYGCALKEIESAIEKIPDYLTKRNEPFQQMMHQALSSVTTIDVNSARPEAMEELRKIAISFYKVTFIQTYQLLWTAYLKAGMGQLMVPSPTKVSYSTTVSIWPKSMRTLLRLADDDKTDQNESYSNSLRKRLTELDRRLKQYQTEWSTRTNNFQGYTSSTQTVIETYIERNIRSLRMDIEHRIELIHYDCHIQASKLEFLKHKPNAYQSQTMKQISQSQYERDTTEQEYLFLKQQVHFYGLPEQSFESSPLADTPIINSIQDVRIRQELIKQVKDLAEESRAALFHVYLKSAEDQREESKTKHDAAIKCIFSSQHASDNEKTLSSIMIHLISEHCHQISERIKCIYRYKAQALLSGSSSLF